MHMIFTDITDNPQTHYLLDTPGKQIYFLFNRSCTITFELAAPEVEISIFALCIGKNEDTFSLNITQKHTAPHTTSHLLTKSVLLDHANFRTENSIILTPEAQRSISSQTTRNLLLSKNVQAFSQPNLEILADDVICHHASTTSHPSTEQTFYVQSRGLSPEQSQHLLMQGFVNDFFLEIEKLGNFPELKKYKILQ